MDPYPLTFTPFLLPKVWGGDRLSRFNKAVKAGEKVGESWELADLPSTSTSGAGGGAFRSVIANGALKGRTLHEAMQVWGEALTGSAPLTSAGDFPLLIKLLDASENLSVQVHPSPAYAALHPGANLKTECWYVLDAAPDSKIYMGVKPGVTRASFEAHIKDGSLIDDLVAVAAVAGDCHTLPSGTVHALGAGVQVAEVQTPSDTTFRVYDWGRAGRELHIRESLECIHFGPAPRPTRLLDEDRWTTLVENEFFRIDEVRLPNAVPHLFHGGFHAGAERSPLIVMVLTGEVTVGGLGQVPPGGLVLFPASVRQEWEISAIPRTRVLAVSIAQA